MLDVNIGVIENVASKIKSATKKVLLVCIFRLCPCTMCLEKL